MHDELIDFPNNKKIPEPATNKAPENLNRTAT